MTTQKTLPEKLFHQLKLWTTPHQLIQAFASRQPGCSWKDIVNNKKVIQLAKQNKLSTARYVGQLIFHLRSVVVAKRCVQTKTTRHVSPCTQHKNSVYRPPDVLGDATVLAQAAILSQKEEDKWQKYHLRIINLQNRSLPFILSRKERRKQWFMRKGLSEQFVKWCYQKKTTTEFTFRLKHSKAWKRK